MNKIVSLTIVLVLLFSCKKSDLQTSPTPPPIPKSDKLTVAAITPNAGNVNTVVTITGTNFDTTAIKDTVKFNGQPATVVTASDSILTVLAPAGGTSGVVSVTTTKGTVQGPAFTYGDDVYVVGTKYTTSYGAQIVLWKNGIGTAKSAPTDYVNANALTMADTTTYIAGYYVDYNVSKHKSFYLQNNTAVFLSNGKFNAEATSIAVAGADVYVGGFEYDNDYNSFPIARYWKNGAAVSLTANPYFGQVNGMVVSEGTVYACGYKGNITINSGSRAVYWKEGVPVTMAPDSTYQSYGLAMDVSGPDVYVAGYYIGTYYGTVPKIAVYWKNGTHVKLSNTNVLSSATAIAVDGTDVYVAGYEQRGQYTVAKYWKNGIGFDLSNGATDAMATAITVKNGIVYVAGYVRTDPNFISNYDLRSANATYWINGTAVDLGGGLNGAIAHAIFVKKH